MKKVMAVMAVLLVLALSVFPAFAEEATRVPSPSGGLNYTVTIIPTEGGTGSYAFTTEIVDGKQGVHLDAIPNEGFSFASWDIQGSYTVTNLDSATGAMDIVISSDIVCTPYYSKPGDTPGETIVPSATAKIDNNTTSPKTGNTDTTMVVMIALAAVLTVAAGVGAATVVAKKK